MLLLENVNDINSVSLVSQANMIMPDHTLNYCIRTSKARISLRCLLTVVITQIPVG